MLLHLLRLKGVTAPGGLRTLAGELLERVNLGAAAKRKVKSYSGGMRQRLGIAQAIAGRPELIIVDEPTAGLDPEERLRFYGRLAELARDRAVLLWTHIVEDVAVLCPRFAIIRQGRLLATRTPHEARGSLARAGRPSRRGAIARSAQHAAAGAAPTRPAGPPADRDAAAPEPLLPAPRQAPGLRTPSPDVQPPPGTS
jgi:ABC-type multidrug transport system ATPase subunit